MVYKENPRMNQIGKIKYEANSIIQISRHEFSDAEITDAANP
jgi:hypothetical protein